MIDPQVLGGILLTGRLIAVSFILMVLFRQYTLFRLHVSHSINMFRILLFSLSIVLLLGNVVPIIIDVVALSGNSPKSVGGPTFLGVMYTLSNMTTSVVSSIIVWVLYRMAATRGDDGQ